MPMLTVSLRIYQVVMLMNHPDPEHFDVKQSRDKMGPPISANALTQSIVVSLI